MFSPFKIPNALENYCKVSTNFKLANDIRELLDTEETQYFWDVDTSRQTAAAALRHTKMFPLRLPVPPDPSKIKSTSQWNQVMVIESNSLTTKYPIFQELCDWVEKSLLETGASDVKFGRIFFSKHAANTEIGLHTDEGEYFKYYDRFHFVIDQVDHKNIFYIRDEPIELLIGGLYWVNNHVPHWLANISDKDRINCIIDARLS